MHMITVKFGGTSLASAAQIRKAAEIIQADPARRFVVASAPGKRTKDDIKVTDLLYRCYNEAMDGEDFSATLEKIRGRFQEKRSAAASMTSSPSWRCPSIWTAR